MWRLGALAVLLALVEFRLAGVIGATLYPDALQQVTNVTLGLPDWAAWQNRLLTSWMVRGLSELSGENRTQSYPAFLFFLTVVKNGSFAFALNRLTRDPVLVARYLILFSFACIALSDTLPPYPWDYVDVTVFTLFLAGVFRGAGDRYFSLLFLPALFNRESALFIPLWMALDATTLLEGGRLNLFSLRLRRPRRFLLGIGLLTAGAATILFLRHALLVREMVFQTNPEFARKGTFRLLGNLKFLVTQWFDWSPQLNGLTCLLCVGVPASVALYWKRMDDLLRNLSAVLLAMLGSVLLLGMFWERRLLLMLVPFLVLMPMHHLHLQGKECCRPENQPHGAPGDR